VYVYDVTAEDANNDILTFSLNSQILGMDINATSGQISWFPVIGGRFDVSVRVSDGKLKDEQNFTINVTQLNRAPKFMSKAVTAAMAGIPYQYLSNASDDDGDTLEFSLVSGPPEMTVESTNGKVSWTPGSAGNFSVVLKVADGMGGEALQEFTITVGGKIKPGLDFITPSEGQKIKGKFTVTGVAIKGTDNVTNVQLRVDSGYWIDATGTVGWQITLDTTKLKNGQHTFQARAFDGTDYSELANKTVTVDNQKAAGKGFIPGPTASLALLALSTMTLLFVLMRRR
jgi:hypothetical protein